MVASPRQAPFTLPPICRPRLSRRTNMTTTRLFALVLVLGAIPHVCVAAAELDFNRDVRPILSNNCYFCHGPDPKERKGGVDGLRLDTPEGAKADLGDGRFAIVPSKPA